jgi:hypothetical protein
MSEAAEQVTQEAPPVEAPPNALKGVMISTGESDEYRPLEEEAEAKEEPESVEEDSDPEAAEDPPEDDDPRVEFTPEQQEVIEKKIIARLTARHKAQMEEATAAQQRLEQQLQEMQSKTGYKPEETVDPETGAPVIPPVPDPFDADYDAKIEQRDQALSRRARWEAEQEVLQYRQQEEQQRHIQELNKRTEQYLERGKEYGLTKEDAHRAGTMINEAGGIPPEAIDMILEDEAGLAITDYLGRNLSEVEKIQSMPVHKAAAYLVSTVKPKAVRSAKRRGSPPPPVSTERGRGSPEEEGPPGVTYE